MRESKCTGKLPQSWCIQPRSNAVFHHHGMGMYYRRSGQYFENNEEQLNNSEFLAVILGERPRKASLSAAKARDVRCYFQE